MVIEYDGTGYAGFQRQVNGPSIQEELERALEVVTKKRTGVTGSGRTDAGVHAHGQVVNFFTDSKMPAEKFLPALNRVLPRDIRVKSAMEAEPGFHARFSARSKLYRYTILNTPADSPFMRHFSYWYPYPLDLKAMRTACGYLVGEHDFLGFSASGASTKTSIRNVLKAELCDFEGTIQFWIEANGFLYNMVRIVTGTLLEIGRGKLEPCIINQIFSTRDRRLGGPTAPARGLSLMEVKY